MQLSSALTVVDYLFRTECVSSWKIFHIPFLELTSNISWIIEDCPSREGKTASLADLQHWTIWSTLIKGPTAQCQMDCASIVSRFHIRNWVMAWASMRTFDTTCCISPRPAGIMELSNIFGSGREFNSKWLGNMVERTVWMLLRGLRLKLSAFDGQLPSCRNWMQSARFHS